MNGFWFRLLTGCARLVGPWFFNLVARLIACGFFLFSRRRRESLRFYAILFPEKSRLSHLWLTFRQYQNFTTIHFDRFLASRRRRVEFSSSGWPQLKKHIGTTGALLLMSHLGNWEMAAKLLKEQQPDLRLLLYMGVKEKEGLERLQKQGLQDSGVTIIGEGQQGGSPFSAVEGINFLREGGLVSMTGDIVWRREQRHVTVDFLGHKALLPEAPYVFALVSGAPIFPFFVFRTGRNRYHFQLGQAIHLQHVNRKERARAIGAAARQYASQLESMLREHPDEWFHFDRFLL